MRPVPDPAELFRAGTDAGLDAVGICTADPFDDTRVELERRRADGLADTMQFTFRNPARATDPSRSLPGAASLVVGARDYRPAATPPPDDGTAVPARVADYASVDHYGPLRAALGRVAEVLEHAGFRTRVLVDDNALVDRAAAHRAGLGWFGKNANLLLPGLGSQFVLGSVLTDAVLEPSDGPVGDGCGPCRRCVVSCPTGAIVEPGVVDGRRCLAWLVQREGVFPHEHRVALGDRIYGCDDCQTCCPVNVRGDAEVAVGPAPAPWVDAVRMLEADDDALLEAHGRWYIPRREPRYLRRNALIVIGNTADPHDPRVVAALARSLADPDPIVAGHAVWAARRMGRDDLLAQLHCEADETVRAELDAEVAPRTVR